MACGQEPHYTFCVFIFWFIHSTKYVFHVFLERSLYSEPFHEVINHCDLPCSAVYYFFLMYFYVLLISFIFYHDLMIQVISGRWCTCVLATSSLMCLRVLVPIVGLRLSDLMGPLLSLHHHHHHHHLRHL
jgi:hypothetical protein